MHTFRSVPDRGIASVSFALLDNGVFRRLHTVMLGTLPLLFGLLMGKYFERNIAGHEA